MQNAEQIKVWDPLVRIFHWSLVASFMGAYLSGDEWLEPHVFFGYAIAALLAFRLVWGLIGSRHARFSDFVYSPANIKAYLRDLSLSKAKRYLGHNPAGGAMVILLLVSLVLTVVSGLAAYGAEEGAGPMAGLLAGSSHWLEEAAEEGHEFFANFTLLLVFVHVGGVLVSSRLHKENLVRAMFTGKKAKEL